MFLLRGKVATQIFEERGDVLRKKSHPMRVVKIFTVARLGGGVSPRRRGLAVRLQ